jgi:hypothetical protein
MIEKIKICEVEVEVDFKVWKGDNEAGQRDSVEVNSIKIGDVEVYEIFELYGILNRVYEQIWEKISWS